MLFCCTQKVLKKFQKHYPVSDEKAERDRYTWYANFIKIARKDYLLCTHSETLFSLMFYCGTQKQIKDFPALFEENLRRQLAYDLGSLKDLADRLLPVGRSYALAKTNDRSILGSMNDFSLAVRYYGEYVVYEDDRIAAISVNATPMRGIDMQYPREKMRELLVQ